MTTKAKKNYNNFKFNRKDTLLFGRESEGCSKNSTSKLISKVKNTFKKKYKITKYWYGCSYNFIRSFKTKS